MKNVLALSSLCLVIASPLAFASNSYFVPAQACYTNPLVPYTNTYYDGQGIRALPTGTGSYSFAESTVICPVSYVNNPLNASVTVDSMSITYYDYDNQKPMSCYYQETNWDQTLRAGTSQFSGSQTINSTNCVGTSCQHFTDAPTYVGQGTLTWSSNPLSVTNQYPINAAIICDLQASGGSSGTTGDRIWNYSYTIN